MLRACSRLGNPALKAASTHLRSTNIVKRGPVVNQARGFSLMGSDNTLTGIASVTGVLAVGAGAYFLGLNHGARNKSLEETLELNSSRTDHDNQAIADEWNKNIIDLQKQGCVLIRTFGSSRPNDKREEFQRLLIEAIEPLLEENKVPGIIIANGGVGKVGSIMEASSFVVRYLKNKYPDKTIEYCSMDLEGGFKNEERAEKTKYNKGQTDFNRRQDCVAYCGLEEGSVTLAGPGGIGTVYEVVQRAVGNQLIPRIFPLDFTTGLKVLNVEHKSVYVTESGIVEYFASLSPQTATQEEKDSVQTLKDSQHLQKLILESFKILESKYGPFNN